MYKSVRIVSLLYSLDIKLIKLTEAKFTIIFIDDSSFSWFDFIYLKPLNSFFVGYFLTFFENLIHKIELRKIVFEKVKWLFLEILIYQNREFLYNFKIHSGLENLLSKDI